MKSIHRTVKWFVQSWILILVLAAISGAQPGKSTTPPADPQAQAQIQASDAKIIRNLEYVPGGHERQKLDLYIPSKSSEKPLPLIVWVHGGAFRAGSKENPPARQFVALGFAVASINYRFSQHAIFPAQIEDCKAAIRFLRANAKKYNIDPTRIGVWGSSAGGHLVAMLGTTGDDKQFDKGPQPRTVQRRPGRVRFLRADGLF
jgi:acetyl esterase/lipase